MPPYKAVKKTFTFTQNRKREENKINLRNNKENNNKLQEKFHQINTITDTKHGFI